jgi:hypothetical protein
VSPYKKAIIALLGGVGSWGVTASSDATISQVEWFGLLGVVATALGVAWFANAPTEGV